MTGAGTVSSKCPETRLIPCFTYTRRVPGPHAGYSYLVCESVAVLGLAMAMVMEMAMGMATARARFGAPME